MYICRDIDLSDDDLRDGDYEPPPNWNLSSDEEVCSDDLGAISQKLLGGKLAPKLIHFILRKELLRLSEMAPRCRI